VGFLKEGGTWGKRGLSSGLGGGGVRITRAGAGTVCQEGQEGGRHGDLLQAPKGQCVTKKCGLSRKCETAAPKGKSGLEGRRRAPQALKANLVSNSIPEKGEVGFGGLDHWNGKGSLFQRSDRRPGRNPQPDQFAAYRGVQGSSKT